MKSPIPKQAVRNADGRGEDIWPLPNDEEFLCRLFTDLFENYHDKMIFGPVLPGAAYELKAPGKPKKIALENSFLTIHWGTKGHIHLCLGTISLPDGTPNAQELVAERRPGRVELYRSLDLDGYPHTWGLRVFNGKDQPQISVFFPDPYVTDDDQITSEPDWSRIKVWEELLQRYTGNAPDGFDRTGRGFGRY